MGYPRTKSVEPLHVKSGHCGGSGGWKYEEKDIVARRGTLNIQGFWNYEITGVRHDSVTIEFYEEKYYVRPEEPLRLYNRGSRMERRVRI